MQFLKSFMVGLTVISPKLNCQFATIWTILNYFFKWKRSATPGWVVGLIPILITLTIQYTLIKVYSIPIWLWVYTAYIGIGIQVHLHSLLYTIPYSGSSGFTPRYLYMNLHLLIQILPVLHVLNLAYNRVVMNETFKIFI